jgi:hypothetical protein
MKVVAAVLVTLLLGASAAHAGWVPSKKLPKPIDSPMVRPKLKESHKPLQKLKMHPPGAQVSQLFGADTARA